MAFLPNSFGFLMHRGGRDTRVPVRAASRQLSATPTQPHGGRLITLRYQHDSRPISSVTSPRR
ncbi:MAG: hypothetical protein LBQ66_13390 [Planctomycetaceae bacterium]|nr:hypothetical protein [Planctomycetaceae bacterium]